jgi:hypothetical protein
MWHTWIVDRDRRHEGPQPGRNGPRTTTAAQTTTPEARRARCRRRETGREEADVVGVPAPLPSIWRSQPGGADACALDGTAGGAARMQQGGVRGSCPSGMMPSRVGSDFR